MSRFKLAEVDIDEIVFVEKNARYMEQTTFNQLVDNIRRDGELSSVPFTIKLEEGKDKGKYEVISGNHRVKAAKMAGISRLTIMYAMESNISNDEKRAIQLSHNSITGLDDLEILRQLVDEIQNTDYKEYAHIDESVFEELNSYDYNVIQPKHDVVGFNFIFFDSDKDVLEEVLLAVEESMAKDEEVILFPKAALENFQKIVSEVQKKHNIKSFGITVLKMAEIAGQSVLKNLDKAKEEKKSTKKDQNDAD